VSLKDEDNVLRWKRVCNLLVILADTLCAGEGRVFRATTTAAAAAAAATNVIIIIIIIIIITLSRTWASWPIRF